MQTFIEILWFIAKCLVVYIFAGSLVNYGINKYAEVKLELLNEILEAFNQKLNEYKEKNNAGKEM